MSTVRTYLVLIFIDQKASKEVDMHDPDWMWSLPASEGIAINAVERLNLHFQPSRIERHIALELFLPLTQGQLWALEQLKKQGSFVGFYVRDEISPDIPVQEEEGKNISGFEGI